jgi:hypothetical protein
MQFLLPGKTTSLNLHAAVKRTFYSKKPNKGVVLLLDGNTSHGTDPDMLELAQGNGIMMVCLPPHSTYYIQHLHGCFFKPLKHFYARK